MTSNKVEQNIKGPPAVTEALSTSGKNMKGPPAGAEAFSTSNSVMVSISTWFRTIIAHRNVGWVTRTNFFDLCFGTAVVVSYTAVVTISIWFHPVFFLVGTMLSVSAATRLAYDVYLDTYVRCISPYFCLRYTICFSYCVYYLLIFNCFPS